MSGRGVPNITFAGTNNPVFIPGSFNGIAYETNKPIQTTAFLTNYVSSVILPPLTSTVIQNIPATGTYNYNVALNPAGPPGSFSNATATAYVVSNISSFCNATLVSNVSPEIWEISSSTQPGICQVILANPNSNSVPAQVFMTRLG